MKQKVMLSFWVMALSLSTQNCQQQIKNKTVNPDPMIQMILIPGGTFTMGGRSDQAYPDEESVQVCEDIPLHWEDGGEE